MSIISFIFGFVVGNILNIIELFLIAGLMKDIRSMLRQFKNEGNVDKWLK